MEHGLLLYKFIGNCVTGLRCSKISRSLPSSSSPSSFGSPTSAKGSVISAAAIESIESESSRGAAALG